MKNIVGSPFSWWGYTSKGQKHTTVDFLEVIVAFYLGNLSIVALYWNLFGKLGKSELKNWNLHSDFFNPKKELPKE